MIASLSEAPLLAPDLPALWPGMLVRSARQAQHLPFGSRSALYFYFARNAIWQAVKLLGLEGYEVLAPAYHHGVEIEALLAAGATVRFYRIGPRWDVDLDDLASKIGDRTRALSDSLCGISGARAGDVGPLPSSRASIDRRLRAFAALQRRPASAGLLRRREHLLPLQDPSGSERRRDGFQRFGPPKSGALYVSFLGVHHRSPALVDAAGDRATTG